MNDVLASCSANDVSSAQSEHYRLNSQMSNLMDTLSADQKRAAIAAVMAMANKAGS